MGEILSDIIINQISSMYAKETIAHCNRCHHEQYTMLGKICNWCGGDMIEE